MSDFRRPGVYLEESLQTSPTQAGSAVAVSVFAGVTAKGDALTAVRVDSWSDFVQKFGGFEAIGVTDSAVDSTLLSYLPYAVFSYYQNGGRTAYVVRVLPSATGTQGDTSTVDVTDGDVTPTTAFTINANGAGMWGNDLSVTIVQQALDPDSVLIFSLVVKLAGVIVETFNNLSMNGIQGTRPVLSAINDPVAGSRFIALEPGDSSVDPKPQDWPLTTGANPGTPTAADLTASEVIDAMREVDNPLIVSFQPFRKANGSFVMPPAASLTGLNSDRNNVFVVWDGNPLAAAGSNYVTDVQQRASNIGTADSYSAIYAPWIIIPDPSTPGGTLAVPPSGSVMGMTARVDATSGVWRAPAGLPAVLSTAVGTETKFSDTDQGNLNYSNVNVIRAVPGSGICAMGARTRKLYGPDRNISARRTLIFIEESLVLATQFGVFENNDVRLWSSMKHTAINILQPIWERGGLAGATAASAFFVICDSTINTPQVVQSGEVHMEVGVALQYPAEFVVIRISQFDSGNSLVSELTAV